MQFKRYTEFLILISAENIKLTVTPTEKGSDIACVLRGKSEKKKTKISFNDTDILVRYAENLLRELKVIAYINDFKREYIIQPIDKVYYTATVEESIPYKQVKIVWNCSKQGKFEETAPFRIEDNIAISAYIQGKVKEMEKNE